MSGDAKKDEAEAPPLPLPGRRFVQYKPKGSKTILVHVVLPDGHREVVDTHTLSRSKANGIGRAYLTKLTKERGIPSIASELHARGEMTSQDRHRANNEARAKGLAIPFPIGNRGGYKNGVALPRGQTPIETEAEPDEDWRAFAETYEQKCVVFFMRTAELLLLGLGDHPHRFVEHVRALVLENMEGVRKRKMGRPPGTGKRLGRPPGRKNGIALD